ncbi:MAG: Mth938-like domain-containing protein [Alphaproteobacteria bacterium]|nr:Mth938-like domain-containing protein [Alphaproteobacteria bacterium]
MDITPLVPEGLKLIQAYGDRHFRVSGEVHEGSLLIFPRRVLAWPASRPEDITCELLMPVVEAEETIEVLLLGTGKTACLLPKAVRESLRARGIGVEVMDTGAACRTYNVLATEERLVAAALIAVD